MSVTLRKRENKDFTTTLYLDIYHNGKRHFEFLKECKLVKITSPSDRVSNKEKLNLANQIRDKRSIQLQSSDEGIIPNDHKKIELKAYFESYISTYTKKDKRNVEGAYHKFLEFSKVEQVNVITLRQLNEHIVQDFADYLKHKCSGEGAHSYFARFKKVLKQAVKEKLLLQSPAHDVSIAREESFTKDVLSIAEIQKLASTDISNKEVKRAFLFSCVTGLRWVDVKDLKWKHIDLENNLLNKVQAKTDIKASVTLNATALSLLPDKGEKEELVYNLPSHTGALKALRSWVEKAEIDKHITWHCARHSFATNLIVYDTDVLIVSKLLGHNTLKYTQRYTHVANDLKKKATDNLPTINI